MIRAKYTEFFMNILTRLCVNAITKMFLDNYKSNYPPNLESYLRLSSFGSHINLHDTTT